MSRPGVFRTGSRATLFLHRWYLAEASCEFLGTAAVLFAVVSAAVLSHTPWPWSLVGVSASGGAAVTGAAVAVATVAVLLSPLGRTSGGHLNPALTIALWLRGVVPARAVLSYCGGQVLGAGAGVLVGRWVYGPQVHAHPIDDVVVSPQWTNLAAAGVEAALTATLVLVVLSLLSDPRSVRWIPLVVGPLVGLFIWWAAPVSGGAFSPARALGPDLVAARYPSIGLYLIAPVAGAAAAALIHFMVAGRPLTAMLRHDSARPCTMACSMPHSPTRRPAATSATQA